MVDAAAQGLGIIGKTFGLPIPDAGDDKRPNKKIIVDTLFSIMNNVKIDHKVCSVNLKESENELKRL